MTSSHSSPRRASASPAAGRNPSTFRNTRPGSAAPQTASAAADTNTVPAPLPPAAAPRRTPPPARSARSAPPPPPAVSASPTRAPPPRPAPPLRPRRLVHYPQRLRPVTGQKSLIINDMARQCRLVPQQHVQKSQPRHVLAQHHDADRQRRRQQQAHRPPQPRPEHRRHQD